MAAAGIDIYKVSRWMGHSSIAIMDITYTHLFEADRSSDMEKLGFFLTSDNSRQEVATQRHRS
ncbi:hypothetical protein I6E52_09815 [Salinibacterium sp. NG253]|nr:hypothetical protein [Salinibacterium sp. NG253]